MTAPQIPAPTETAEAVVPAGGNPQKNAPRTRLRKIQLATMLGVLGPGLIAGLSDDDPAGITTYSVLGTDYGYQMLWVLGVSTIALVMFQSLGARIGVVTGQGLAGLIRQKFGARSAVVAILALLLANIGTTAARDLMGDYAAGRGAASGYLIAIAVIALCIIALGALSLAS